VRERTDCYLVLAYSPFHTHTEIAMNMHRTLATAILAGTAALSGCASNAPYANNNGYNNGQASAQVQGSGTIDSIQVVQGKAPTGGGGAIIGGLVGALAGNQIGSGGGRTAATIAGGVGGALVGNNIEANRAGNAPEMYQINIRMENGDFRSVTQDTVGDLHVGNRVRIVDGRAYRY
jgi:outer membrane lipoprotein SlyB